MSQSETKKICMCKACMSTLVIMQFSVSYNPTLTHFEEFLLVGLLPELAGSGRVQMKHSAV